MLQKQWQVAAAASPGHLQRYRGCSPIMAQLLVNRGFDEPEEAESFLQDSDLRDDPFLLADMEPAVERIFRALDGGQGIAVYGDFDADGICATVLLTEVLQALGGDVLHYIPDRAGEGYGLNLPALHALVGGGIALVITVDCGIRSVKEVEAANEIGLDVIVSDHHSLGPELPPALATINPQRPDCGGEAGMAGVGVAFMLAQALLLHCWKYRRAAYPPGMRLSQLLDLVALGTVADVMALNVGLNRRFVQHGLRVINDMRRPGIAALAQVARLRPGSIQASHVGFALGPRINAAGRLSSAMTAYELLAAPTVEAAMPLAQQLQRLNVQRQELTRKAKSAIGEQVHAAAEDCLIFAVDSEILPGIVGLVAGRLCEQFYLPAVVLEQGVEASRGSCRSIPEFNITQALDECADLLLRHGGHALAAGFTVANHNLALLQQELTAKARAALQGKALQPHLPIDMEVQLDAVHSDLLAELERLEPTGKENPPATFLARDVLVQRKRTVGADKQHLKLTVAQGGRSIEAIGFFMGARQVPPCIDIAFQAQYNEWNGQKQIQLQVLDIRPAAESP